MKHLLPTSLLLLSTCALLLSACGGGVTTQVVEDLFTPMPAPVDLVWVVDNSSSMEEAQTAVGEAFPSFLEPLTAEAIDWRLGVITTDMSDPEHRGRFVTLQGDGAFFIGPASSQIEQRFYNAIRPGTDGSNLERGLEAAWAALSPPLATHENEGFLRDEARLALIFVSDEDDCSDEGELTEELPGACVAQPDALVPLADYLTRFRSIEPGPLDFSAFALVETGVDGELEGCGGSNPGTRYMELARRSGGAVLPLCGDLDAHMATIGQAVSGLPAAYPLSRTPVPETLEVSLKPPEDAGETALSTPIPEDPTRTQGWSYEPRGNTIRFWGTMAPQIGETLEVRYRVGLSQ